MVQTFIEICEKLIPYIYQVPKWDNVYFSLGVLVIHLLAYMRIITTLMGSCIDKKHHFAITFGYNFLI